MATINFISSKTGETEVIGLPSFPKRVAVTTLLRKQISVLQEVGLYPKPPVIKRHMTADDPQLIYFLQASLLSCRGKQAKK